MRLNTMITPPHKCSYLSDRLATTVFAEPFLPDNDVVYSNLTKHGFRRSGEYLYRPYCQNCQDCISVRIPINSFKPRRIQKRIWKKNQDLQVIPVLPNFKQEHFDLYCRYVNTRHKGGNMDNPSPKEYMRFLTSSWSITVFYEFRLQTQLVGLAVIDQVENSLSAVYTFFEPIYASRSLGVYAILWEIEESKRLNLEWLYLGYFIKNCQKMSYKTDYQPLEGFINNKWQILEQKSA